MGKQMKSVRIVHSSTSKRTTWHSINWDKARHKVRKLQMRIAKAVKEGEHGKVKSLQGAPAGGF
jgi:RNA-directed DNA polymerase